MELTEGQLRYRKYIKSYKAYRDKNSGMFSEFRKIWRDKFFFGGNRKRVLERDGYKCIVCGMTDEEHRKKWGRGITIDHFDGCGRNSKIKNNDMDNLYTMCLSCHGRKDKLRGLKRKK